MRHHRPHRVNREARIFRRLFLRELQKFQRLFLRELSQFWRDIKKRAGL